MHTAQGPSHTPSPRPPIPRRYILLGVGLLILILGSVMLLRRLVDVEAYRGPIVSSLAHITGHSVSVGKMALSPIGGLFTLELRNLEIRPLDPATPPLLLVERVLVGMTPLSFFHHVTQSTEGRWHATLTPSSLTLIHPRLHLTQHRDTRWIRWLQEIAHASNSRMEAAFGFGLVDFTINSIKVQKGMVTLHGWRGEEEDPLVFDRIQANMHGLSADSASPVSVSARFQSVPFTITGHVGPLPHSLILVDMPILLNLEAKYAKTPQFDAIFTSSSPHLPHNVDIRGARGYFSTLVYGTLKKGLRTNSRLELDKLVVEASRHKMVEKAPPAGHPGEATPSNDLDATSPARPPEEAAPSEGSTLETVSSMPMDWAVRQKSVLTVEQDNLSFQVEELFLYLDRKPILDIKGVFGRGGERLLDLQIATLEEVHWDDFPHILFPFLSGKGLQGTLHIHGSWPNSIALDTRLDLSHVAFAMPPPTPPPSPPPQNQPTPPAAAPPLVPSTLSWLQKIGVGKTAGTPLFLDLKMVYEEKGDKQIGRRHVSLVLEDLFLSRSPATDEEPPPHHLRVYGTLQPALHLEILGAWELAYIREFLPAAAQWQASGHTRMQMTLSAESPTSARHRGDRTFQGGEKRGKKKNDVVPVAEGYIRNAGGQLGNIDFENLFARIKIENGLLHVSDMEIQAGLGRLDGYLQVDLFKPQPSYQSMFTFSGLTLETMLRRVLRDRVHLSGVAFGHGHLYGTLDNRFFPVEPYSGTLHLVVEPGRITGLHGIGSDEDLFLHPPDDVQTIFKRQHPSPRRDELAVNDGSETEQPPKQTQPPTPPTGTYGNLANPKQAFYWNRLETDVTLHNTQLLFDHLRLVSGGLTMDGHGVWHLSGAHNFDIRVHSSLKEHTWSQFSARIQGDGQTTVYQPQPTVMPPSTAEE